VSVLNIERTRDLLQQFKFKLLFIDELGWSLPTSRQAVAFSHDGVSYERLQIAQLSGVVVFEIHSTDGRMPDAKARTALHKEVSRHHHENLLIFLDQNRTQSLWYWVKREGTKIFPREHLFVKGQPGDLFLSKLGAMVVDISDLDDTGSLPITEVATRLKKALDIERVTKKFFNSFKDQRDAFLELIEGIADDRQRRWYASVLLNRLMFIYFLQKKGFLDSGNQNYLHEKLAASKATIGVDKYFSVFLKALFFEGFAKPEYERSPEARKLLGTIKYLNGGLFLPHTIEQTNPGIHIPDIAFENLFDLYQRYSWNLNDTPGGKDDEINPDVLGYIFEKYINQKAFGAYYTRPEITEYLCERTVYKLILDKINTQGVPGVLAPRQFDSLAELLLHLDANLCRELLFKILPKLSLLDPACGSGAFLVAAMKTLINLYSAVIGKIEFLGDRNLTEWLKKTKSEHKSIAYFIKKSIITDNLYGVDIMEEATEIAKLRLFLALVAAAQQVDELEPLPNIDFNILAGNSLIGLIHVDPAKFDSITSASSTNQPFKKKDSGMVAEAPALDFGSFSTTERKDLTKEYRNQRTAEKFTRLLEEKNRLIDLYRHAAGYAEDLRSMRDTIEQNKKEAVVTLNKILLEDFNSLGIKFEEATWDIAKSKEGKPNKRPLSIKDIEAQHPFHWGYEFDEILNKRGGFDAIITNPPWEIFKPNAKEFLSEYSELITKKNMDIKEFEKEQAKLMTDPVICNAWIEYQSRFSHVSQYFRGSNQYKNQISVVNGKKAGSDINLYKLFLEQCFNLQCEGGRCGIIIPSGVYTDLGTKQLREMLFSTSQIDAMFGLSNEKFIFETVHHAFKFCILSFQKGGKSETFNAAFRINPREAIAPDKLDAFLHSPAEHLYISVDFVRRLAPDSLSVMEFKNDLDVRIAEKMLKFPLLGDKIDDRWNLSLTREFDMTNDSHLFKTDPNIGRLPLYEGKMIWQFNHQFSEPRYWVAEKEVRSAKIGRLPDNSQMLDYQECRLGLRAVSGSVNERTLVATVLPPNVVCGNSLLVTKDGCPKASVCLVVAGLLNSFIVDGFLRQRVSQNINMFYLYQLPVPRLTEKDPSFRTILERVARLICTTPEFDGLAKEAGIGSHKQGVTNEVERRCLRAELDGLIAHLYSLTEEEFAYILTTFPLVADPVKIAARNAYRDVERGLIK